MARSLVVDRTMRDAGRGRRWRSWITAALLAACVDGPTSPGMFGELRIRPSYQEEDAPGALGLSVDSAEVHIVRVSEPNTALVDTMVRYESDTASMGWVLTLRAEEEPLLVDVSIWANDDLVYTGEREVVVRESAIAESGAEPVLVAYVGPAIVTKVTVSPDTVTLAALEARAPFSAEARDRHGVLVSTTFAWTSADPDVATVDSATGAVTAVGNGTTNIHAASGSVTDSATVVVAQKAETVSIAPTAPTLTALGATVQLQAVVSDANGFAVDGASVTWSSSDEAVLRVDQTGTVTAIAGGAATITAAIGSVEGSTPVTVNPVKDVASITVSPAAGSLTAVGATLQFSAQARDAGGNLLAGVQFAWSSSADSVATIDESGLGTAASHGTTTVSATAGSISGNATLSIDLTTSVAQIVVAPPTVTLTAIGETQQFTAVARDANDAIVPGVTFTWSSSSESVATINPATGLATATGNGVATITVTVGEVQGTASMTVNLTKSVASVVVTPPEVTLTTLGATQQFTAVARDANDAIVPGMTFVWSSSTGTVATIGSTGLATATGDGAATITATVGEVQGTASMTVNLTKSVVSVVVSPPAVTLTALGVTQQFTAVARDVNDAIVPGITFAWSSSAEAVATIGATGLATVTGNGSTTIGATVNGVSGIALLTADLDASVTSVVVSPASALLTSKSATQQFTAVARDANKAIVPGVTFTWNSSSPGVATIGATGLATVTGNGLTTITATVNDVSGTASLTADLTTSVASVVVSPSAVTLTALGATQQFTAVARDVNDAIVPGVTFTWISSAPGVATIGATGLATVTGNGSTTITATVNGVSGTALLTADLESLVTSVVVSPTNAVLTSLGARQQFTAVARDENDALVPGITFVWSSSAEDVATIGVTGLATVTGNGSTTITATVNDVSGSALLTANLTKSVASVVVTPAAVTLTALDATQQFTAVARDVNDAIVPGVTFTWNSSAPGVATIGVSGLATVTGNGSTTITATVNGVSGMALLTADLESLVTSVVVSPTNAVLTSLGATRQFTAVARDANETILPGVTFAWTSSSPAVATIGETSGLATATGNGSTTITATVNGVSDIASLTSDLASSVTSVVVSPASALLTSRGATQQFTAVARDSNEAIVPGVRLIWSTSSPAVATIDEGGLATSVGHGATTITATIGNVQGSAALAVDLSDLIASITVSPRLASLASLGVTQQFTAEARDEGDEIIPGMTFTWASSLAEVASIDETIGLATAVGNGATTITASAGGRSGTAELTVEQRIVRVEVTPTTVTVPSHTSVQLTATAYDANDRAVSGVSFAWISSDTKVALVSSTGFVDALVAGTAQITARVAGATIAGSATVTVP